MEIGPQPHGVVRSNIYTAMKCGVQYTLDWVRFFNSGVIPPKSFIFFVSFQIPFFGGWGVGQGLFEVLFLVRVGAFGFRYYF